MKQRRSPSRPPKSDRSPLTTRPRQELLSLAKQHTIRGRHRMTKAQLIKALTSVPAPDRDRPHPLRTETVTPAEASLVSQPSAGGPAPRYSYENLPETYGVTELVLLPVDPYWIHAYWEVTPQTLSDVLSRLGSDAPQARYVLRVFDVTAIEFDGRNAHSFFDNPVELSARNWYIQLWSSEKSLVADLGLLLPDGRFFLMARSNAVHTPREGVSIFTEAPWAEPSALGEQGPARFRFRSREPRYGPMPKRLTPSGRKLKPPARVRKGELWDKLIEQSQMLTRGLLHPSSPGARRISS